MKMVTEEFPFGDVPICYKIVLGEAKNLIDEIILDSRKAKGEKASSNIEIQYEKV